MTTTLARASLAASASAAIALCSWTGNRASLLRRFKLTTTIILTMTEWQWCQQHQWQHRLTSQLAPLWCPTAPLPRPKPPEIWISKNKERRRKRSHEMSSRRWCWQERAPAYQRRCSLCRWGSRASFLSPGCFAEWSAPAVWDGFYLFCLFLFYAILKEIWWHQKAWTVKMMLLNCFLAPRGMMSIFNVGHTHGSVGNPEFCFQFDDLEFVFLIRRDLHL